jgi:hypothetical protein
MDFIRLMMRKPRFAGESIFKMLIKLPRLALYVIGEHDKFPKMKKENHKDFSEEFTKISSHAREEILWVRSVYKLVFSGVIALIAVGIELKTMTGRRLIKLGHGQMMEIIVLIAKQNK